LACHQNKYSLAATTSPPLPQDLQYQASSSTSCSSHRWLECCLFGQASVLLFAALFLPRKTHKNNFICIKCTGNAALDIISSLCCNKRLHQRFVVCTFRKLALPHRYVWGQSCFHLQHIVPHSLDPVNAPMWRHTRALPIESKQATHRHSQFLQKNSIQSTIILNFDFWMKELKELSSLLQFACSTSTREPLYTTYTKHKNQKKLWHKFCYNPSTPSILSIIQRQKSLSPSGMALPCNKSSIGNACRKFLQVGYGPIRQFCAQKLCNFVARSLFLSLSNTIASEVSSVFYLAELDNNLTFVVKRFYLHDISKEKMKSWESRGRLTDLCNLNVFRINVSRCLQNGLDVRPVWKEHGIVYNERV